MRQILVYSDSLSWGIVPATRKRLPFVERWPGKVVTTSNVDGVHLDADQHLVLATALAAEVMALLDRPPEHARHGGSVA